VKQTTAFIKAIINTYAILFFSQNKVLGVLLLSVSFLNPVAGASALFCVMLSISATQALGYSRETIQAGFYSFNSLLLGLAFGTFYAVNFFYVLWLVFTCIVVIILNVILVAKFGKTGLPVLSLPFILCFWLLLAGGNNTFDNGLIQKSNLVVQGVYNSLPSPAILHSYITTTMSCYVCLFFRALSAVLFQNNIITGILIAIGLLIHSRISFSLLVIGFIAACGFNAVTNIYPNGISYYYLGANFMMSTTAIGSFFLIPSWRSYFWAILCIPVIFLLTNALSSLLAIYNLPVFSMPFCIANIGLIYFLLLRKNPGKLQLVFVQHYSPERNLYQFLNQQKRLDDLKYFRFSLPFMGEWTVSQGYDGTITHKGEWNQALDFVIANEDKKVYRLSGTLPEHFYCYNKPVLACGDGVVANVVNHVEDNIIGEINTKENWGNTVVIKHLDGLYSKVSHLKKGSIEVRPGDIVKKGDLLGLCGNSGRSPIPHLHFQIQTTPYIDAKTLAYPFAYYSLDKAGLKSFEIPKEGDAISPIAINRNIKNAFDFSPGFTAKLKSDNGKEKTLEVYDDEWGQSYLHCKETGAVAYFVNNGFTFYFTSFYGDEKSLLYYFYLSAYNVNFNDIGNAIVYDEFPLHLYPNKFMLWLQDFVAPFKRYLSLDYHRKLYVDKSGVLIKSHQFTANNKPMDAEIFISGDVITEFEVHIKGRSIKVKWE
jgi:urea transporter